MDCGALRVVTVVVVAVVAGVIVCECVRVVSSVLGRSRGCCRCCGCGSLFPVGGGCFGRRIRY